MSSNTIIQHVSASGAAHRIDFNGVPRRLLDENRWSLPSGTVIDKASGIFHFTPITMATGYLAFGGRPFDGPNGVGSGWIFAPGGSVPILSVASASGGMETLVRHGSSNPDEVIWGGGVRLKQQQWRVISDGSYAWDAPTNNRIQTMDRGQVALRPGVRFGLGQLTHGGATDKLGAWAASGFANVATGLNVQASGMQLAAGPSGAVMNGSGMSIGEARYTSGDIYLANGGTPGTPSLVPSGGGRLFISPMTSATGGALMYYGPSGTLTLIGRP